MKKCPRCGELLQHHHQQHIERFWQAVPGGQAFFGRTKVLTVSWTNCPGCGFLEVIDFQPAETAHEPLSFN